MNIDTPVDSYLKFDDGRVFIFYNSFKDSWIFSDLKILNVCDKLSFISYYYFDLETRFILGCSTETDIKFMEMFNNLEKESSMKNIMEMVSKEIESCKNLLSNAYMMECGDDEKGAVVFDVISKIEGVILVLEAVEGKLIGLDSGGV